MIFKFSISNNPPSKELIKTLSLLKGLIDMLLRFTASSGILSLPILNHEFKFSS